MTQKSFTSPQFMKWLWEYVEKRFPYPCPECKDRIITYLTVQVEANDSHSNP